MRNSRSITRVTRAAVHNSLGHPWAFAPFASSPANLPRSPLVRPGAGPGWGSASNPPGVRAARTRRATVL